jgi:ATP synthase F1 delta subunit
MWQDTLSKRYAQAFMNVVEDHDSGLEFLSGLSNLFENNKKVKDFLSSPAIHLKEKTSLVETITEDLHSRNFLNLLITKGRLNLLQRITRFYQQALEQEEGVKNGDIYTPYQISKENLKGIEDIIGQKTRTKVNLKNVIDQHISIGFKAIVGNLQVDNTLDNKLQKLIKRK